MDLRKLNDEQLLTSTDQAAHEEREALTKVLHHIREVDRRRLYSKLKFSSLFKYVVERLKYSEDQAWRRIAAMKLLRELPEIEAKINTGELTLTNLGLAQTHFISESAARPVSSDEKRDFLKTLENQSSREAKKIVLSHSSEPEKIVEKVRVISNELVEHRFAANNELQEKIETLKGFLAHKHPRLSLSELVNMLCDLGLKKWNPAEEPKRTKTSNAARPAAPRKYRVENVAAAPSESFEEPSQIAPANGEEIVRTPVFQERPRVERVAVSEKRKVMEQVPVSGKNQEDEQALVSAKGWKADLVPELAKRQPVARITLSEKSQPAARTPIPAKTRRDVWRADNSCCRNCGSRYALEIDHIIPSSCGGPSAPENLRLLCRACNQRAAIEKFGVEKMEAHLHQTQKFTYSKRAPLKYN